MLNKVFFLGELNNVLKDPVLVRKVYELFEKVQQMEIEERKLRQLEGIRKAKEQGKTLGRPRLKEPEGFQEVVRLWSQKRMNVHDAAQLCGMGVSTFYRRVNDLIAEAERVNSDKDEKRDKANE